MSLTLSHHGFVLPVYSKSPSNTRSSKEWWTPTANIEAITLEPAFARVRYISNLSDDWDGNGSIAPLESSISKVKSVLPEWFKYATATEYPWSNPFLSVSEVGEVVAEWWYGKNKLTVYINENGMEFIKVWGTNINSEMEDGQLSSYTQFQTIWMWLNS